MGDELDLEPDEREALIHDIATRAGTAKEIAKWYGTTPAILKAWVEANTDAIKAHAERATEPPESDAEPTPMELGDLWITNKFERLKRLQRLADRQYQECESGRLLGADLATGLREFRSYLALAANELGQLLHRGSGDAAEGETLAIEISGVDMETLK